MARTVGNRGRVGGRQARPLRAALRTRCPVAVVRLREAITRARVLARAPALLCFGLTLAPAAHAGLGEAVESVQRDHAALRGSSLAVTAAQAYDRHEITTPDGTRVREYVSHAGTVFAVTWSGRSLPDLKVVLAQHYDEYASAATGRRGNHHVLSIATPGLVLNIRKLPRGFTGGAHVPALLPPGVAAQDIR